MKFDLNVHEVQEAHDVLSSICRRSPGTFRHLESMVQKLRRQGRLKLCTCCGERMSQRKDGICNACHSYRESQGELPAGEVLIRRSRKPVTRSA